MKSKYILCLLAAISFVFFTACASDNNQTQSPANKKETGTQTNTQKKSAGQEAVTAQKVDGTVNWLNVRDLENAQQSDKRKVMVDLYTDWCGWCKRMDKATFQHKKIANILNEKFHAVKFDAEDGEKINFKGEDHLFVKSGRKGFNQLAHKFANGRLSYPTIAFLDEDLNRINSFPGYKAPGQFDALLNYIAEDKYKSGTSLAEFERSFKSEIPASEGAPTSRKKVGAPKVQVVKK